MEDDEEERAPSSRRPIAGSKRARATRRSPLHQSLLPPLPSSCMPAPKPGPALFLGVELSTDQLRASIVDESLELVGVESVDFDSELDYQTQGGIFTTPGDAYTTPVEMWIKGLDLLLAKLARNHDLARVKSIGGAAQHALVWWKSTTVPSLSSLDPNLLLHEHFSAHTFSLPNTPVFQDTASHAHALVIEDLLLGPERMAARVGTAATPSMVSAQLLRVRETWQQEVWARTGRIQLASAFLCSLLSGKWISMGEAEACATGMWVHANTPGSQGHWDEGVLDIVGGSREEGRRVRGWLGDVDTSGGGKRAGNVSRYLVERYRFDPETLVAPFTSDYLANYLSLCPSPNDAILSFGPMDMLLTPAQHYMPTRLYNLVPHPAQDSGEKRRYIATLCSRNADVPRALVRDMYTKSWSAFDRLVAIVPPGGSIGLDDKLFSFWHLQADSHPYSHVKGIYRFETGVKVNEFRDLRANPRCLLESQVLAFRVKWSHMLATGALGSPRRSINANTGGSNNPQTPPPFISSTGRASTPLSSSVPPTAPSLPQSLGLTFDPYDHSSLPTRIISTGAAANFPSISNLVGDIFNAPVFVPSTQVDSAQIVPHRNAPVVGFPGRAALGGAYVARWVWGKERVSGLGGGSLGAFEDEIKRLLQKRWIATGGVPLRTNVGGATTAGQGGGGGGMASSGLLGLVAGAAGLLNVNPGVTTSGNSGANSGSSTPFGSRSGLGATLIEEEEEEFVSINNGNNEMIYGLGISSTSGGGGGGLPHDPAIMAMGVQGLHASGGGYGDQMRMRTHTGSSTVDTIASAGSGSVKTNSTTYTTPDITSSLSMVGLNINSGGSGTNGQSSPAQQQTAAAAAGTTNPTPLTPVVALPTSDSETQLGLAKVAEADTDAFLTYAAIVPEFCRLEGMLIKGIV